MAVLWMMFLFIQPVSAQGWNHRITIDTTITLVDGLMSPFDLVKAGDSLFIQPGARPFLLIRNIDGNDSLPVTIINDGGPVVINTDHYFGISIQNCRFIRLTGTGDPATFYGIAIDRVGSGGGLGLGSLSTNYEIDHISIKNCIAGGINAKTDPDCSLTSTRDAFTQYNTRIHDNYIDNVGDEAMYIGSTKYYGQTVNCNGKDTLLLPSLLSGVRVYNNIVRNSGMDGIQVSSASEDCKVYGNLVMYDSWKGIFGQMSGITIGGGSKCDCYNNRVEKGNGNGIEIHGLGGMKIYNNLILEAGRDFEPADTAKMRHGIYVTDVSVQPDSSFHIMYNTIVKPKSDGIRFKSILSGNNLMAGNAIIDPGNFDYYENGPTSFNGNDAYIMIPDHASEVSMESNFFSRTLSEAMIDTGNWSPLQGSPLIDKGSSVVMGIWFDYYNHPRPYGAKNDIGAIEYNPLYAINPGLPSGSLTAEAKPNPFSGFITISCQVNDNDEVSLEICDLSGKSLYSGTNSNKAGEASSFQIDLSALPPGMYVYMLRSKQGRTAGRIMKL